MCENYPEGVDTGISEASCLNSEKLQNVPPSKKAKDRRGGRRPECKEHRQQDRANRGLIQENPPISNL